MPVDRSMAGRDESAIGRSAAPPIMVDGVRYRYPAGERDVLQGVTFSVSPGQFVGITGAAGAGKSTLCMCLNGLIPYSLGGELRGTVKIGGVSTLDTAPGKLAETVAMVFQDPEAQIIGLTVAEDLAFGPENLAVDPVIIRERIPAVLQTVGMEGFQDRETYSLSGGQKQRVAIAAALMLEPDVLILDEPTSELDPLGRVGVLATIRTLRQQRSLTVVMVDHDMEELTEVAERIIIVDNGEIIADSSPAELYRDTATLDRLQGIRIPQAAEVLLELEREGRIAPDRFSPLEADAIGILSELLEASRGHRDD